MPWEVTEILLNYKQVRMKKRKLMILNLILLMTTVLISSCSKDDPEFVELNGKFLGGISDCEGAECRDYIEFIGNSQADLSMGDIISRVDYKLVDKKIELYFDRDSKMNFSFLIKDERTLVRIENNTNWIKL